jgi:ppGpp synthetase/RelA/SpoT-type nucleotidyltranferase
VTDIESMTDLKEKRVSERIVNRQWLKEQVKLFTELQPRYNQLEQVLREILEKARDKFAPLTLIQSRTKSISSFTGKVLRKRLEKPNPILEFTDLCGIRVIVMNREHIETFCDFIKANFDIDWDNSIDVSQRLKVNEFGYRSVHYIVSLREDSFREGDIRIDLPKSVLPDNRSPMKAEIQVRTMLEHCWAECSHDVAYKGAFKLPSALQRELAVSAALLENTDSNLTRINNAIKRYYSNYGSYMTIDEIEEELEIGEIIIENSPADFRVAHHVGKLALASEHLEKAVEIMSKHIDSGYQPLLRDLGVAMTKLHKMNPRSAEYMKGQEYLQKSIDACCTDIDALSSLAGTYKGVDDLKAHELYRKAYFAAPDDPYVLGNYIECEIKSRKDSSIVSLMQQSIQSTIKLCWEMIEAETNYPWVFYDLGKFYLLNEKPYIALMSYLRAIQHSTAQFMVRTSRNSLINLKPAIREGSDWVEKILTMGAYIKFNDQDALSELRQQGKASGQISGESVVLVVGTCDVRDSVKLDKYYHQIIDSFRDYKGVIISGGTDSGISKITGDIQEFNGDRIRTIGYVPEKLPANTHIDKRYKLIISTNGDIFDPGQPLQYWTDILAAGVNPRDVKVLALGGSLLSAFEIMLALTLGASVVVLAGAELDLESYSNSLWNQVRKFIVLPNEKFSLRSFIGSGKSILPPDIREKMAEHLHNKYRSSHPPFIPCTDESMLDWKDLPSYLKESNRFAVDHIIQKLTEIGCRIEFIKTGDKVPTIVFFENEIAVMAEMEHARWLTERLLQGWEYSPNKDVENKKHPFIVMWDKLDEKAKEIDRNLVRDIPWLLSEFNIRIVRNN